MLRTADSEPMSLRDPNPIDRAHPRRIAIVIANPTTSTTTGWPVGFRWSELAHPYLAFHACVQARRPPTKPGSAR